MDCIGTFVLGFVNKKNMKKEIKINGNSTNEFTGNVKIKDLESYLDEIKELGYTHIDIITDDGYFEVDFIPYYERFENDAEYSLRLSREADFERIVELNELRELKRLKEKYEK